MGLELSESVGLPQAWTEGSKQEAQRGEHAGRERSWRSGGAGGVWCLSHFSDRCH